ANIDSRPTEGGATDPRLCGAKADRLRRQPRTEQRRQNSRNATPALMRSHRYRMSGVNKWATPTKCAWYCEQLRCGFQIKCNRGSDAPGRPFIPPPTVEDVAMRRFSALYQIETRASSADVAKL